jgi:hypothetical protein
MDSHYDEFRHLFVEERLSLSEIYERLERKVKRLRLKEWGKQLLKENPLLMDSFPR